jgi:DNA polymerase (family 10)
LHSTGSKEHNIAMRALAMKKGMLLSNHGLFRAAVDPRGKRVPGELIAAAEEADIFVALGMKYVEPEARE